jgi:hypothetical protein
MENESENWKINISIERIFAIILLLPLLFEWNQDNDCASPGSIYLGLRAFAGASLLKGSSKETTHKQ